jgi:hydrophobic/amphiphilic exporter-1 (mainly G- bacteria), HAE1 family
VLLTRLSLRNPIAVTLLAALIGLLGLGGLVSMGRGILPPLALPVVVVGAPYPGASPPELERLVVEPIEDELAQLPEVERISASAQDGNAQLVVRFRIGTTLEVARETVQRAVDAATPNLPPDLVPPLVARDDRTQAPVLDEAISSAVLSPFQLAATIDRTIVPALRATPGVGAVTVSGAAVRQFTVVPRSNVLDALGATVLDLQHALATSDDVLPGGTIVTPLEQRAVGVRAAAVAPEQLRAFPFAAPGSVNAVTVGAVAAVRDEPADPHMVVRVDGAPAVLLTVSPAHDAGSTRVIDATHATFVRLARRLPLVRFAQVRSSAPYTNAALEGVLQTLGEGIVLTVLVMLLFLRSGRDALIAAVAIPTSLGAAFATMWALALTINVLSLMGLSLTIGILVDDSIVIIEAIARAARRGLHGDDAALAGRTELGGAAIAITLVDVAVFAPLAAMNGLVGAFMREFGLVVVIATAFSLLVSFTLTPLLAARWSLRGAPSTRLPGTLRVGALLLARFARAERHVRERYVRAWLPAALRRRRAVAAVLGLACAGGFALLLGGAIPSEFSPPLLRGELRLDFTFPAGTTLAHTAAGLARITGRLLEDDTVAHVVATAGRGSDGANDVLAANRAQLMIVLRDPASAGEETIRRVRLLGALVPDARITQTGTGMGGEPPIDYTLRGDPQGLALGAQRLVDALAARADATDIRRSDGGLGPRLEITIQAARAQLLGVSPDDAAQTARIATAGTIATKVRLPEGLVEVLVRADAARRGDIEALGRVAVRASDGRLVPLSLLASFDERRAPAVIDRENRGRIVTVSANPVRGAPIGPITARITALLRTPGFLPAGVEVAARGDVEQLAQSAARIGATLAASLALVYAILAILYRSYAVPLVVMTTVPLAAVGAFGTLALVNALHVALPGLDVLRDQTLNLYSMLGIVMLVGLVAKNGILLVDYAERASRAGSAPEAAVLAAAERRFRPIVMTTAAMIAGMLPLALGEQIGAGYRKALGTVVIGGLASSLVLTLFAVPLVYVTLRWKRVARTPQVRPAVSPAVHAQSLRIEVENRDHAGA